METNFTYRPSPTALLNPCSNLIFKKLFTDNSEESRISLVREKIVIYRAEPSLKT